MLTIDVESGNLREGLERKSRHHIPWQIPGELNWKIDQIYKRNIQKKKLLKTREPDNESERIIEEVVNKKF